MSSASIIRKNAQKGAEFENEYYSLLKDSIGSAGLMLKKQFEITPYWRLDAVFGTQQAIDYLKSAKSAEQIRNCPHYWDTLKIKTKKKELIQR